MKQFVCTISLFVCMIFLLPSCQRKPMPTDTPHETIKLPAADAFYEDTDRVDIDDEDMELLLMSPSISKESKRHKNLNEIRLKYLAKTLAKSLKHPKIRQLLKKQIGKKFDGDYDVLWETIKDEIIDGKALREHINSRFSDQARELISVEDIEQISLLNISLPVKFQDWAGLAPIDVAYWPVSSDDRTWTDITAYDTDQKKIKLDARQKPDRPVLVTGINERVDPVTKQVKPNGIVEESVVETPENRSVTFPPDTKSGTTGKAASPGGIAGIAGKPLYLEWFLTFNDYDGWLRGNGEFEFLILTDLNKSLKIRYTDVEDNTWYHKRQFFTNYYTELGKYLSVKIYETDDNDHNLDVSMSINKFGINASYTWKMDDDDDFVGENQLIDISGGPLYSNRYTRPWYVECYPAGDVRFTLWWDWRHEYNVSGLPYVHRSTTTNKSNDWDVGGSWYSDGRDACYMFEVNSYVTVDITTQNGYTDYDTMLEIFDRYGSTGQFNDDFQYTVQSGLTSVPLPPGLYYIVVDGYGGATGNYELDITRH